MAVSLQLAAAPPSQNDPTSRTRLCAHTDDPPNHKQTLVCAANALPPPLQLLRLLRPRNQEGRSFEVSTGTYTSIVKTLSLSCRGSSQLTVSLLEQVCLFALCSRLCTRVINLRQPQMRVKTIGIPHAGTAPVRRFHLTHCID